MHRMCILLCVPVANPPLLNNDDPSDGAVVDPFLLNNNNSITKIRQYDTDTLAAQQPCALRSVPGPDENSIPLLQPWLCKSKYGELINKWHPLCMATPDTN